MKAEPIKRPSGGVSVMKGMRWANATRKEPAKFRRSDMQEGRARHSGYKTQHWCG